MLFDANLRIRVLMILATFPSDHRSDYAQRFHQFFKFDARYSLLRSIQSSAKALIFLLKSY